MSLPELVGEAVLSTRSDAIIAADRDGRIVYWNPGAERIFGFAAAEAVGQSLDLIIPERLRERHWHGYEHTMKTGESRYGEGDVLAVPAVRKDGTAISVEFTIAALKNDKGQLSGMAAIIRDTTKRFEEMKALRRKLAGSVGASG
jgi:PAS domain S-box-containing protein